ncbi:MAG TPA: c-type cytochrome [Terriglobia bacterium]|nr:c-type cytochrome [Terriglobia bacterium]
MKRTLNVLIIAVVCFALGAATQRFYDNYRPAKAPAALTIKAPADNVAAIKFEQEPLWAYGFDKPPAPGEKASPQNPPNRNLRANEDAAEQTRPRPLQGSKATYSLVDIRDGQNVIDWFPGDHPAMPSVVAHGPAGMGKTARGCGSCHLPNGKGRPENAGIAGLPIAYFQRQIDDFRNGRRHTADPRKPNTNTMIELAKSLSEDELRAAAEYFGSMKWTPWIRVVETDLVPKTRIAGNLFLPLEAAKSEPIAGRIIEMPENEEQAETYRNPHSGFVAYVPVGSLSRGKDLVTTGGARKVGNQFISGKTTPCITCHGPDLMGVTDIPPIAGRSPSYMVRQMWDIQQGTRPTQAPQLMKLVVANLTTEDMIAIAAYVSSLKPPAAAH